MNKYLYILFTIFVFACSNKDEEDLLKKIKTPDNSSISKIAANTINLSQYKDIELKYNSRYVADLKNMIDDSFNKQLKEFEDNELGVLKGYKYMFMSIAYTDTEWEDLEKQLSERYFGTLQVAQDAHELGKSYLQDIEALRSRFYIGKTGKQLPNIQVLSLPPSDVYLNDLDDHSVNNLNIEISTRYISWFLGVFLFSFLGIKKGVPIIVFIIEVIVSFFLTINNDSKLLDSIREQQNERIIDFNAIKTKIDDNTIHFYETIL